jgi:hypothetical protein
MWEVASGRFLLLQPSEQRRGQQASQPGALCGRASTRAQAAGSRCRPSRRQARGGPLVLHRDRPEDMVSDPKAQRHALGASVSW